MVKANAASALFHTPSLLEAITRKMLILFRASACRRKFSTAHRRKGPTANEPFVATDLARVAPAPLARAVSRSHPLRALRFVMLTFAFTLPLKHVTHSDPVWSKVSGGCR